MCKVLQVSRSGYYAWLNSKPSLRQKKNEELKSKMKIIFTENREVYGYRRLKKALNAQGESCNYKRVRRLMQEAGLKPKMQKRFKVTTRTDVSKQAAANQLRQEFSASNPNSRWVSDISYFWTDEGWLYLAVVIDLYSRCVVGWSLHHRLTTEIVLHAVKMACFRRKIPWGLILHSDRGVQYTSRNYQILLKEKGISCSMSGTGNCFDNAVAESFFHSIKTELTYHQHYKTREEAKQSIFEYIEVFYNRKRLHSYCQYLSPIQFEEKFAISA
jgi:putative transposase